MKAKKGERFWPAVLGVLFVLALGLRLAVFFQGRGLPQVETPFLDSRYYLESARAIAHGEGFEPKPYFMNPGYLWLAALFDRLFENPQTPLVLFQIVLDGLTCLLTAVLTRRLFGLPAGIIAGLLLAFNGYEILAATRILPETPAAFLMAVLGLLLTSDRKKFSAKNLLAAGAVLGVLALLRSNAILIFPFLLLALRPPAVRSAWKEWARGSAFLLAGGAAAIVPVTLRNYIAANDFALISSSGGINFYMGNSAESDGRFLSLKQLRLAPGRFDDDPSGGRLEGTVTAFAEERAGRRLKPSEVSAFWTKLALSEIGENLGGWAKLLLRKVFLYCNGFEIPQIENLYFLSRYLPALEGPLSVTSRLLWPLSIFGLLALLFRPDGARILLWIFGGYALSVILFFVTARHRLPVVPIAGALAGFGAAYLIELFRTRHPRRFVFSLLFAGCFLFSNLNPALGQRYADGSVSRRGWFGADKDYYDFASQHNNTAALLLERGDWASALQECQSGLAIKPSHPTLLYNLGRGLEMKADLAGAREAMRKSLTIVPNNAAVAAHYGDLAYKQGDWRMARKALEHAVVLAPNLPGAWNSLGPVRYQLGEVEGALAALLEAERLSPGWLPPVFNRGLLLSRLARYAEAVELFDSLRQREPENRQVMSAYTEALIGLAEQHLAKREKGPARAAALRALSVKPNHRRAQEILKGLK